MKKILPIILCAVLMFSFAGCGGTAEQLETLSTDNIPKAGSVKEADFKDDLSGLESYFEKLAYLPKIEPTKMTYATIGAVDGDRYRFKFNNSTVTIELYEYDMKNLNDDAKRVIKSIKKDGSFDMYGTSVEAMLSDSGKYLMIYSDQSGDELNTTRKEAVVNVFKAFKKQ